MTETSPVSFQSGTDDPIERRVSTVGRIHPHLQVKITDPHGRAVPVGSQGEILTRGYSVMQGYWEDPERTRDVIDAAGWMHTGDLGIIDAAGYCNITGRLKDMLIRGGENIYPREVEEFLYRHPKVQAAQVSAFRTRHGRHRAGHPRVLLRADRPTQDSPLCPVCQRIPADCDGQSTEVRNAGADVCRAEHTG